MRHNILVKFINKETLKDLDHIKEIFNQTLNIDGIHSVEYHTNCIDRDNRYDLLIVVVMNKDALNAYDESAPHKTWKKEYTDLIEKKAIFDYED